jgi:hypothetical protein
VERGVSLEKLSSLSALILLPFVLKFFYAPLLDKLGSKFYNNASRFLFVCLSAFCLSSLFLLGKAQLSGVSLYYESLWLLVLIMSFTDVVADTLAIEASQNKAKISLPVLLGLSRCAGFLSLALASLFFKIQAGNLLPWALFIVSFLSLFCALKVKTQTCPQASSFKDIALSLKVISKPALIFMFLYGLFVLGSESFFSFWCSQNFPHIDLNTLTLSKILGFIVSFVFLSFPYFQKKPVKYLANFAFVPLIVLWIVFAFWPPQSFLIFISFLLGFTWAIGENIFLTYAFKISSKKSRSSNFVLLMSLGNIGFSMGEKVNLVLNAHFSFQITFIYLALTGYGLWRLARRIN